MSKKAINLLTKINVQQIVTYGICLILFVRYAIENILGGKPKLIMNPDKFPFAQISSLENDLRRRSPAAPSLHHDP